MVLRQTPLWSQSGFLHQQLKVTIKQQTTLPTLYHFLQTTCLLFLLYLLHAVPPINYLCPNVQSLSPTFQRETEKQTPFRPKNRASELLSRQSQKLSITKAGSTPRLYQPIIDGHTTYLHISGKDNVVADALLRSTHKAVTTSIDYSELAVAQRGDAEIQNIMSSDHGLQLKLVQIPGTDAKNLCDVSRNTSRLFITETIRRAAFDGVHNLAHHINITESI
ncbi:hypothetical protein TSAR_004692 [Trichomalopsis sarcophagae]|uniref:Uncharacterized protein n=1 Tax=Trichomalopsis sarcophagae TaxID=543379 RepID=A0A232EK40_9HYME|nr:hypothetical protein TSAR_004692 [Trichomalopsis sarcophagae]